MKRGAGQKRNDKDNTNIQYQIKYQMIRTLQSSITF